MSGRKVVTPSFEILRNGGVLKVVPLRKARLVVGSDAGVDLRLKHPAIAGRHLEIAVVGGKYLEARNLAGEGKVHRSGEPVDVVRLREGDELDLGPVALRLTYNRGKSAAPVPQAQRAAPEAIPDDETPTDADAPAPFRSPPPEVTQPSRAPFQDRDEDPGQIAEAPTQTMRALRPQAPEAPTEAMAAVARPAPKPLPVERGLESLTLDPIPAIVLSAPGQASVRVPLHVGTFEIGTADCDLPVDQPGVAPVHAAVMVMPDGAIYLRHLAGVAYKTTLDGEATLYARWTPGAEVAIGPMRFTIVVSGSASSAHAAHAPPPRPREPEPPWQKPEVGRLEPVPARALYGEDSVSDVAPPFGSPFPYQAPPPPPTPVPDVPSVPLPPPDPPVAVQAAPAPAPVAPKPDPRQAPPPDLVKVRRKSEPAAPAPSKPAPPPLFDDDIEVDYRAPLWQRAGVPLLVAALLAVIGFQFWAYNNKGSAPVSTGPRVANGQAPDHGGISVDQAGGATMVVGDPRRRGGGGGGDPSGRGGKPIEYLGDGGAGGYGGASGYIDPANDWDPGTKERTYGTLGAGESGGQRATATAVDSAAAAAAVDRANDEAFAEEKARALAAKAGTAEESAQNQPKASGSKGWVEMKDVEAVIYENRKQLRYCYSAARESNPRLAGVMWMTLTLGTDGRIRKASLESKSTIGDDGLFQCLRRQLSTMAMPTPDGGPVSFSYPFELTQ